MMHNRSIDPDPWLRGIGSTCVDYGPDGFLFASGEALIAEIRARLRIGRPRKRPAHDPGYQWVYNPPDEMQAVLRALRFAAPNLFWAAHKFLANRVATAIDKHCPGSIGRIAFHDDSGRWHCEGVVCKYGMQGRKLAWAVDLHYDVPSRTAAYETRLAENKPLPDLRINSLMAVQLRGGFIKFQQLIIEHLRKDDLLEKYEAARRESRRVLIAQAIRRELALMLRFVTRGSQKTYKARERIEKWAAHYRELFPESPVPSNRDFSLLGVLYRVVDESQLPASEKDRCKLAGRDFIIGFFRKGFSARRSQIDATSPETGAACDALAWMELRQFVEIQDLFRRDLIMAFVVDRDEVLNRSKMFFSVLTNALKIANAIRFVPVMIERMKKSQKIISRRR